MSARIESLLADLAEHGVHLRKEFGVDDVIAALGSAAVDHASVLVVLGQPVGDRALSDDVLTLVTGIDDGYYEHVVRQLARMGGRAIDLDAVRVVPGCGPELELAYPLGGETRRWQLAAGMGQLDPQILAEVARDLSPRDEDRGFVRAELGDHPVVLCTSAEMTRALAQRIEGFFPEPWPR